MTEQILLDLISAMTKNEPFNYSDDNMEIHVTPNSTYISYSSNPKKKVEEPNKDEEVKAFLEYCDNLDDDFFVEVCESFSEEELNKLQDDLDTINYKNTISVFKNRVKEVSDKNLAEIAKIANENIKEQETAIMNAQAIIKDIKSSIDLANKKYSC